MKKECERRALDLASPWIPTTGIRLPSASNRATTNEAIGTYIPQERGVGLHNNGPDPRPDELEGGWGAGLYLILQKLDTGGYPLSDAIYMEFATRMRSL